MNIEKLTIEKIHNSLIKKEYTCLELIEVYLQKIIRLLFHYPANSLIMYAL